MTPQEILAQVKAGGFAIVRLEIVEDFSVGDQVKVNKDCIGPFGWVSAANIIAIEPPPMTDAEKLAAVTAELEAAKERNAELAARLAQLEIRRLEGALNAPSTWTKGP